MAKLFFLSLCSAALVIAAIADPIIRCPTGFHMDNEVTGKVMMDYRQWQTCTDPSKTTCPRVSYSFTYPCDGCVGDLISGETFFGCHNEAHAEAWISHISSKDGALSGLPFGVGYVSSSHDYCNDQPCFDFSSPALSDLECNQFAESVEYDGGTVLTSYTYPDGPTKQCAVHQEKCYTSKLHFTNQETGKPATLVSGGCHDNYDRWFDRYYPHVSNNKNFCKENGCMDWPLGCLCFGAAKIDGKADQEWSFCEKDKCNKQQ